MLKQGDSVRNDEERVFLSFIGEGERVAALSPDGSLVAFCVRAPGRASPTTHSGFLANGAPGWASGSEIRVINLIADEERVLTPNWGSSWHPRWSPDGRRLAFFSDRDGEPRVWLWDRDVGTFRVLCGDAICVWSSSEGIHWLPDGTRVVTKLRAAQWNPPADDPESTEQTRDVWVSPRENASEGSRLEGWSNYDRLRGDIAVIDVATGEALRLCAGIFPLAMAVSPNGQYVAVMSCAGMPETPSGNVVRWDLHLFAIDGSRHEVLVQNILQRSGTAFSWSPQSDAIAYTAHGDEAHKLFLVSMDGDQQVIDAGKGVTLSDPSAQPPLWSPNGKTVYCCNGLVYAVSRDAERVQVLSEGVGDAFGIFHSIGSSIASHLGEPGSVVVMTRDSTTKREGLVRLKIGCDPEVLVPENDRLLVRFLLYGDVQENHLVGQVEDGTTPPDLLIINVATGEERILTNLNPWIGAGARGPRRLISYTAPSGRELQCALFLPPNYEPSKRYPLVVEVYYRTLQSGAINSFGSSYSSWLSEHGYAVLLPDMPVGKEPAEAATDLALAAADAAIEQGYADPDRLGVIGGSQGGYNVCCIVTRTDRFRAAVAIAPFADLIAQDLKISGNRLTGQSFVEGGLVAMGES